MNLKKASPIKRFRKVRNAINQNWKYISEADWESLILILEKGGWYEHKCERD